MIECRLSCVIRPDANGAWFIQNDADHYNSGFYAVVQQTDGLRLDFISTYDKAGTIQISTDDDFAGSLVVSSNLGLSSAGLKIRAFPSVRGIDPPINPAQVWSRLPGHPAGSGNLWVNVTMWRNG
jgi:hypothetical protein